MSFCVAKLLPLLDVDDDDDKYGGGGDDHKRPTVRLYNNTKQPTVIGREALSLSCIIVSRQLMSLEWKDEALHATVLKETHSVRHNNKDVEQGSNTSFILKDGDTLSLYKHRFTYQVRYTPTAASNNNNTTNKKPLDDKAKHALTGHVTCPICMELLRYPVSLVPCGHVFCRDCCITPIEGVNINSCPTCRQAVSSRMANRLVQSLVQELVTRDCLEPDGVQEYRKRTNNENATPAPTTPPNRKRQRRNNRTATTNRQLPVMGEVIELV